MALSIKNPDVDRLTRRLAAETGESFTEAIRNALIERLERETGKTHRIRMRKEIADIQGRIARLTRLNDLSDESTLGYDEHGLPR